jgi:hypothetical protein
VVGVVGGRSPGEVHAARTMARKTTNSAFPRGLTETSIAA